MKRPGSIWLVASLFAVYGAYAAWAAVAVWHWAPAVLGLLALAAAAGLASGRRWSAFLVYLITLLVVVSWSYSIWIVVRFGWPLQDVARTLIALTPGALLVVACAGSSALVFRYFRKSSE